VLAVTGGEQQPVPAALGVLAQVRRQVVEDVARDRDISDAGVGLRTLDDPAGAGAHDAAADPKDAVADVDVAAAKLGQFTKAQRAPHRQLHHQPIPLGSLTHEDSQFVETGRPHPLRGPRGAAAADRHGFAKINSSATAVARMVRSRA
jgi:hypothetical protein